MNHRKFREQRIVSPERSVWDVRRYLIWAANKWADLYNVLEQLSNKDRKEAESLSIYDDEIAKLFRMSLASA